MSLRTARRALRAVDRTDFEQVISQRDAARAERDRYREALERIADPDWATIYPPDVFAETKRIARCALEAKTAASSRIQPSMEDS